MSTRTQHDILLAADELVARAADGPPIHSVTTRTRDADGIWPHVEIHFSGSKTQGQLLEVAADLGLQKVSLLPWDRVRGELVEDDIIVELM